ncbi:MAG: bleomycin resistance protein [Clostridiaceae bacterium]|jgi:lactoylglutathione lyase|nr:bleomycin resistance protein [Clostridiaceae bacterium]
MRLSPLFENVDCVSFYVDDIDEGLTFYQKALGLRLLWRTENACGLGMQNGITELVLVTQHNPMVDMKVDSVEKALPEFIKAGGKLEYGPFDIDIGKCAVVSDPWENRYCILDMSKGTYDVDENGNVINVSVKDKKSD